MDEASAAMDENIEDIEAPAAMNENIEDIEAPAATSSSSCVFCSQNWSMCGSECCMPELFIDRDDVLRSISSVFSYEWIKSSLKTMERNMADKWISFRVQDVEAFSGDLMFSGVSLVNELESLLESLGHYREFSNSRSLGTRRKAPPELSDAEKRRLTEEKLYRAELRLKKKAVKRKEVEYEQRVANRKKKILEDEATGNAYHQKKKRKTQDPQPSPDESQDNYGENDFGYPIPDHTNEDVPPSYTTLLDLEAVSTARGTTTDRTNTITAGAATTTAGAATTTAGAATTTAGQENLQVPSSTRPTLLQEDTIQSQGLPAPRNSTRQPAATRRNKQNNLCHSNCNCINAKCPCRKDQ